MYESSARIVAAVNCAWVKSHAVVLYTSSVGCPDDKLGRVSRIFCTSASERLPRAVRQVRTSFGAVNMLMRAGSSSPVFVVVLSRSVVRSCSDGVCRFNGFATVIVRGRPRGGGGTLIRTLPPLPLAAVSSNCQVELKLGLPPCWMSA